MKEEQSMQPHWYKEPLVHFLLLAILLFALDYAATQTDREEIIVDQAAIDFLVGQREDLMLRPLTPEEERQTIDQYVDDEILYREAYRRGLDKSDSRMRRNLILKIRGLLASEIHTPGEDELRDWFERNTQQFATRETWQLQHIFYANPEDVPDDALEQLVQDGAFETIGDSRFDMPRSLPPSSTQQLGGIFGPDAARIIVASSDNEWHGPLESLLGISFYRIVAYRPPELLPYEAVRPYLADEWRMEQTRRRINEELALLRGDYDIEIAGRE